MTFGALWVDQVRGAVVQVHSPRGGGSAFVVQTSGTESRLPTNQHVVAGQRSVTLQTSAGTAVPAQVLASSAELDLALLAARVPLAEVIVCPTMPTLGERVFALGHPWDRL